MKPIYIKDIIKDTFLSQTKLFISSKYINFFFLHNLSNSISSKILFLSETNLTFLIAFASICLILSLVQE